MIVQNLTENVEYENGVLKLQLKKSKSAAAGV
jgi:HSP20 family molecular chaperone IbpA